MEAVRFAEPIEDQLHRIEIRHLAVAAEIVNDSWFSFEKNRDDRGAMIFNVDPIAHIQPIAVHRQRLIAHRLDDHERDQFLWKLVRAVVIGAARNDHLLPVSPVATEREQIGTGLACRVRRTRDGGVISVNFPVAPNEP